MIKKILTIWLLCFLFLGFGALVSKQEFFSTSLVFANPNYDTNASDTQPWDNNTDNLSTNSNNLTVSAPGNGVLTTAPTTNQRLLNLAAMLDIVLNVLYIIIWPLLAITWLALDNSLVYGEVFWLTTTLRKFRTVVMQISFILLALMILRDIVKMLRANKLQSELPKKIKNRFFAGILIPASRFILAALIDLSTILIYQVGSIPLTIFSQNDDTRILNNSSIINLTDKLAEESQDDTPIRFTTTFSCGDRVYLPCQFIDNKIKKDSWDNYITKSKETYSNLADGIEKGKSFCVLSPTILIDINNGDFDLADQWLMPAAVEKWKKEMENQQCSTIGDLITKSKSMVGPLYTIYGSLLNFTSLNVTVSGKSTESEVMLFLIKAIVWILLVIPLLVLAFISIARVGILWMVITFSPLIILNKYLGEKSIVWDITKNIDQKRLGTVDFSTNTSKIIQTIFQPVLVVLALWLSIVFLSATNKMLGPTADKDGLLQAIWIEVDNTDPVYQKFAVSWIGSHKTDIKMNKFNGEYSTSIFFDYFTRIIANIFWILIMRKMMFMALGSAAMTKSIVRKMQKYWEDYLSSRPVFGGLSYDSVFGDKGVIKGVTDKAIEEITRDRTVDAGKELENYVTARFPWSKAKSSHNSKFDPSGLDEKGATEKLWSGINDLLSKNESFHYLNSSDTPNLEALASAAWINWSNGNIIDLVNNGKFWQKMAESAWGKTLLGNLVKEANNPEKLKNLVWISSSDQASLQSAILRKVDYLRGSGSKEWSLVSVSSLDGKTIITKTTWTKANKNRQAVYNYSLDGIFATPDSHDRKDWTPEVVSNTNSVLWWDKNAAKKLWLNNTYNPKTAGVYNDDGTIKVVTEDEAKTARDAATAATSQKESTKPASPPAPS